MKTKSNRTCVHIVHPYLINPTNPISVNLVGAGGTGSSVFTALARIDHSLIALGHPGLAVTVIDPDTVTGPNLGRQLFTAGELGMHKSVALVNRVNRTFGTDWVAITEKYSGKHPPANITLSCVDNVEARFYIADVLRIQNPFGIHHGYGTRRDSPMYWMDFGNTLDSGQVLLSTVGEIEQAGSKKYVTVKSLPFVTEQYGDLLRKSEKADDTPSCSLAQALEKQDLFINPALAYNGMSLLWNMFRKGMLFNHGFFFDLDRFRMQPIKIRPAS